MDKLSQKHRKAHRRISIVSLTDFYRPLTSQEMDLADSFEWNFDHPDAFDWKCLENFLADVNAGRLAQLPKFDMITKTRIGFEPFPPCDIILLQGILVLYKRRIRDLMSMRLFVALDPDSRLCATVTRDMLTCNKRTAKSLQVILNQWMRYVKPAFEDFIQPTMKFADVIIPRGIENTIALDILVQNADDLLAKFSEPPSSPITTNDELNDIDTRARNESSTSSTQDSSPQAKSPQKYFQIAMSPLHDHESNSTHVYSPVPN